MAGIVTASFSVKLSKMKVMPTPDSNRDRNALNWLADPRKSIFCSSRRPKSFPHQLSTSSRSHPPNQPPPSTSWSTPKHLPQHSRHPNQLPSQNSSSALKPSPPHSHPPNQRHLQPHRPHSDNQHHYQPTPTPHKTPSLRLSTSMCFYKYEITACGHSIDIYPEDIELCRDRPIQPDRPDITDADSCPFLQTECSGISEYLCYECSESMLLEYEDE